MYPPTYLPTDLLAHLPTDSLAYRLTHLPTDHRLTQRRTQSAEPREEVPKVPKPVGCRHGRGAEAAQRCYKKPRSADLVEIHAWPSRVSMPRSGGSEPRPRQSAWRVEEAIASPTYLVTDLPADLLNNLPTYLLTYLPTYLLYRLTDLPTYLPT